MELTAPFGLKNNLNHLVIYFPCSEFPYDSLPYDSSSRLSVQGLWHPKSWRSWPLTSTTCPNTSVSHRGGNKGRRWQLFITLLHKSMQGIIVLIPKRTGSQHIDSFLAWTGTTPGDNKTWGQCRSCGLVTRSGL